MKYVGKAYFKPGDGWHYSNTNYLVLGMLAERLGEAPLGDQIRTRFLEPLGLRHTWYQPTEIPTSAVARGYRFESTAKGARPIDLSDGSAFMPFTSVVTAAGGAGGLASNSSDLARWARALYGGSVLHPDSVDAILGDINRTATYKPRVPYGLGVQRLDIDGAPIARPLRPVARLSFSRALAARGGHRDRGAHQPEPDRSGRLRAGAAQDRAGRRRMRELLQSALTTAPRRPRVGPSGAGREDERLLTADAEWRSLRVRSGASSVDQGRRIHHRWQGQRRDRAPWTPS